MSNNVRITNLGTTVVSVNVTLLGNYSIGEVIGGVMTVNGMLERDDTTVLQSVVIVDPQQIKATGVIMLFNASPDGNTDDGLTAVFTDPAQLIGAVPVTTGDYVTAGNISVACVGGVGLALRGATPGGPIYAVFVPDAAATFAEDDVLTVRFGFLTE